MNNGIIIKNNQVAHVVWLEVEIPQRNTYTWVPRSVTDDEAVVLRGLGLQIGYIGDTVFADLGKNMEHFHRPKYVTVPTQNVFLTDCFNDKQKQDTANFFFADHMMQIQPASILDDPLNLLVGNFKLVETNKADRRVPLREVVFLCYGKLPSVPETWESFPEYSKNLNEANRKSDLKTFKDFIEDPTMLMRLNSMQRKLLQKYLQIRT